MTALDALELAYEAINPAEQFTYALQYYGPQLGYLVIMINETYDSFISKGGVKAQPFFYWEFLINDAPASQGVSQARLKPGATVEFEFRDVCLTSERRQVTQCSQVRVSDRPFHCVEAPRYRDREVFAGS